MASLRFRTHRAVVLAACALSLVSAPLHSQQSTAPSGGGLPANLPTPAQAQMLLQTRPDLVALVQAKLKASGLTPDQVRARLREAGYPEDLLDQYMGLGTGPTLGATNSDSLVSAVQTLGVLSQGQLDSLRTMAVRPGATVPDTTPGGLPIFGLDVFRRSTSQFDATLAGPVDGSYRLGPRDVLQLILTGSVEASYTLTVSREGFIVVPAVGQMAVANLSLDELNQVMQRRLSQVYSGVGQGPGATTQFHISVSQLRTNQIFVVGEAVLPGSYEVSSAGTMLTALYAAGGPTLNGSLRSVELRRSGQLVGTLDLYAYLLRGDASHDLRLETGDILFVPVVAERVSVIGEVSRPAAYELLPGETLADLLRFAGGFTAQAARRRVQIRRILPPTQRANGIERVIVDVDSDQLASGFGPPVKLEPGDEVEVFGITTEEKNRLKIVGDVNAPGSQGFTPGLRLSEVIARAGGVKPDVYLGQVLVTRQLSDLSRISLHTSFSDSSGTLTNDLPIEDGDSVVVYSRSEFRPDRTISVTGAVHTRGVLPYRPGMTLREAVLAAGGLTQGAYLKEAEIARMSAGHENGKLATTVRVPLDSSYLFERGPDGVYHGPPGLPAPAGPGPEFQLLPYDNVLILEQPGWELQRSVELYGEVQFPGSYTLLTRSDRLTDLIRRAGGLTPHADSDGIVFYRREENAGRVSVDLPAVLRNPRVKDNFVLASGDSIFIQEFRPYVKVTGAVNAPLSVAYVPGADMGYYIDAAGGGTPQADADRAYVTQPNGTVERPDRHFLLPDAMPHPRAGAVIHVPEKDPNDKKDYAAIFGSVAQVLASAIAIVAIATRVKL